MWLSLWLALAAGPVALPSETPGPVAATDAGSAPADGGPGAAEPATAPPPAEASSGSTNAHGEDEMFGGGAATDAGQTNPLFGGGVAATSGAPSAEHQAVELPPDNPLTLGGLLYLRSQVGASNGQPPSQWALSAPFLLDTYLDARPNDRVRGFVLVRTLFNPTYNPSAPNTYGLPTPSTPNPDLLIDQMWVKFDVDHKVFVTAGRQHVKWGTAHFWFPNDLLNPVKLSPLAVFDQRTGVTMIKGNMPIDAAHLNLTAAALFEGLQQANQFGKIGGAARAEYVLGTAELGLDVVDSQGQHPRFGGDLSFGLGDFDLYAEWVLIDGRDNPIYVELQSPTSCEQMGGDQSSCYSLRAPSGFQPQAVGGLNYSLRYGNNRVLTFGGEYFYNGFGYTDPKIYPWLLFNTFIKQNDAFNFFYVGQQYAGVYILADKPGNWYNSTFNLSTLGNLSDGSFITRLDFFQQILTHLRLEAFADVHYGGNGEFHLSLNLPSLALGSLSTPAFNVGAPIFDFGVALRLSL